MLNNSIKKLIDESILCWLATVSKDLQPNVSPKEIFTYHGDTIIIANIASPGSVKNIRENNRVSVAFINIFTQKGYQCKGKARLISKQDEEYIQLFKKLDQLAKGRFPIKDIISVSISRVKPIMAPSYIFYPETTEEGQVRSAMKSYGVK